MTNPAGAAIVVAIAPLRKIVQTNEGGAPSRYLVICPLVEDKAGSPVQVVR